MTEQRKNYVVFFAGLLGSFSIRIVGVIYLVELFALLSYLFIPWKQCFENRHIRRLLLMAFLWLVGAIVSDFLNDTAKLDMMKGCISIAFFIALMPFVYWSLSDSPKRWLWYVVGNGISSVVSFYLVRGAQYESIAFNLWQMYAWEPFVVASACLFYYFGRHKIAMVLYLAWGVYCLYGGSRNLFLVLSLSVCIMYMVDKYDDGSLSNLIFRFKSKLIPVFIVLAIGAFFVDKVYEQLAASGSLGEIAYTKYVRQKSSDGNILENGRKETFLGLELALEKPIIGYGSFARFNNTVGSSALNNKLAYYYESTGTNIEYLPTHSHIIGYWVYHGILGAAFWLYVLLLMWRLFRTGAFIYERPLVSYTIYYSVLCLWAICFSPFGQRTPMAFYIVFLILLEEYCRNDYYGILSDYTE